MPRRDDLATILIVGSARLELRVMFEQLLTRLIARHGVGVPKPEVEVSRSGPRE